MKTAIVTDSTAYLSKEVKKALNISMIPLTVTLNGEAFDEDIDINTTDFYDKVRGNGPLPKSSQPSVGKFVELYESLAKANDEVISIHLSSGISGTYSGAVQAGEIVNGIKVYVFDSEVSCHMQGFYVIRAAELANKGFKAIEIIEELNIMKQTMRAYFMVDDLTHLQRGGRLSSAQALIGGLLQIKPILHFKEKVIMPFEKVRTRKKAMQRIVNMLVEDAENMTLDVAIIHGNCLERAEEWQEELSVKLPNVHFTISHFGPVIGTHLGEGAMGLGWVQRRIS